MMAKTMKQGGNSFRSFFKLKKTRILTCVLLTGYLFKKLVLVLSSFETNEC